MNVQLRPWNPDDAPLLAQRANNPKIAKFMTDGFPHPFTLENAHQFIANNTSKTPYNILAITCDDEPVGAIGVHPKEGIERLNAELGYWIAEEYWGKGIGTAAIRQMVTYAFDNFEIERIFARPFGNNPASKRILEKAGFTLEGHFKNTIIKGNEVLDELHFAIRKNR